MVRFSFTRTSLIKLRVKTRLLGRSVQLIFIPTPKWITTAGLFPPLSGQKHAHNSGRTCKFSQFVSFGCDK